MFNIRKEKERKIISLRFLYIPFPNDNEIEYE